MASTLHQLNPATVAGPAVTTGIPDLDACLPAGGWPPVGLIELRVADAGAALLPLLLPHMARL
ncbi:MAG TPA: hypothetical protein VK973_08540, partial [Arenicellales bacterium]|nr:hypothetical protein [Arenicellales bacterium]